MKCKHCKEKIPPYKGNRQKEFCNSTCRSNYWYALNKKGKKAKVELTDLNEPTGKKVVSDPPPKENYSIDSTKNDKGKGNKESAYLAARRKLKQ